MTTGAVFHILGFSCRPDQESKLVRWYDGKHVPDLLKFGGLRRVTRYVQVHSGRTFPGYSEVNYPQHLVVCEFAGPQDYEGYESSPQLAAASDDARQTWAADPFEKVWRVQYGVFKSWGERRPFEIVNLIGNQCRPDQEGKFNHWYNEIHVPLLLKAGHVSRAIRLAALFPGKVFPGYPAVNYPHYLALYEFPNLASNAAYEASPALQEAAQEVQATWGRDPYERIWRTQFKLVREWSR